jgi:hypothetical protein
LASALILHFDFCFWFDDTPVLEIARDPENENKKPRSRKRGRTKKIKKTKRAISIAFEHIDHVDQHHLAVWDKKASGLIAPTTHSMSSSSRRGRMMSGTGDGDDGSVGQGIILDSPTTSKNPRVWSLVYSFMYVQEPRAGPCATRKRKQNNEAGKQVMRRAKERTYGMHVWYGIARGVVKVFSFHNGQSM